MSCQNEKMQQHGSHTLNASPTLRPFSGHARLMKSGAEHTKPPEETESDTSVIDCIFSKT